MSFNLKIGYGVPYGSLFQRGASNNRRLAATVRVQALVCLSRDWANTIVNDKLLRTECSYKVCTTDTGYPVGSYGVNRDVCYDVLHLFVLQR